MAPAVSCMDDMLDLSIGALSSESAMDKTALVTIDEVVEPQVFKYCGKFVAIESLTSSDPLVSLDPENDILVIRNAGHLTFGGYRVNREELTALILTEICCELGKGSVFWWPKPQNSLTLAYSQIPNLLYIARDWPEEDKFEWKEMSPEDRLKSTNGAAATFRDDVSVLTIDMPSENGAIRLNTVKLTPGIMAGEGIGVVLALTPRIYLAWSADMLDFSVSLSKSNGNVKEGTLPHMQFVTERDADRFRVDNPKILVERLAVMASEKRPGSLLTVPQLAVRTCEAYEECLSLQDA